MTDARRVHQSPIARGAPLSTAPPKTDEQRLAAIKRIAFNAAVNKGLYEEREDLFGELLLKLYDSDDPDKRGLDTDLPFVKTIAIGLAKDRLDKRETEIGGNEILAHDASNGCRRSGVSDIYDSDTRENVGYCDDAVDAAEDRLPHVRGRATCCAGIGGACPNDNEDEPSDTTWHKRRTMDDLTPETMREADLKKLREEWAKLTGEEWTEERAEWFGTISDDGARHLDVAACDAVDKLRSALALSGVQKLRDAMRAFVDTSRATEDAVRPGYEKMMMKRRGVEARLHPKTLDDIEREAIEADATVPPFVAELRNAEPYLGTSAGMAVHYGRKHAESVLFALDRLSRIVEGHKSLPMMTDRQSVAMTITGCVGAPVPLKAGDRPRMAACAWLLVGGLDLWGFEKRKARSLTAADLLNEETQTFGDYLSG